MNLSFTILRVAIINVMLIGTVSAQESSSNPLLTESYTLPHLNKPFSIRSNTPKFPIQAPPVVQPTSVQACVALTANAARLECYDAIFRLSHDDKQQLAEEKQAEKEFVALATQAALPENATFSEKISHNVKHTSFFRAGEEFNPETSFLDRHWELSANSKLGTWNLHTYQPVYVLPFFASTDPNTLPHSPNPNNTVAVTDKQNLQHVESKFQVSLKTKAIQNLFGDNGDVWLGYTQSSRWQVYNTDESRPFRETNYEPEASLVFRTNYEILGLNARMFGIGFNHQSNGRSDPFSRSWNRIMFNIGLEKDNFAVMIRPWIRVGSDSENDNPDITNYMGRADLTAYYQHNNHNISLMLRHSLKGGNNSHGAARLDWTFPIKGKLRGHVQLFDGYGESMIDYNHRATYLGLGVSLADGF